MKGVKWLTIIIGLVVLMQSSATVYAGSTTSKIQYAGNKVESTQLSNSLSGNTRLRNYIVNSLSNHDSIIDVRAFNISYSNRESLFNTYYDILNENPQIFYVNKTISYRYSGGKIVSVIPKYLISRSQIKSATAKFNKAVNTMVAGVNRSLPAYKQALIVHDRIITNCEYDKRGVDTNNVDSLSYTAYGVFVKKKAVCQGYSLAYKYILSNKLGITCDYAVSESMNHMWNIVKLANKWYHVDVTWDDPSWDSMGRVKHNNFLASNSKMVSTGHYSWRAPGAARSKKYQNGFWKNVQSQIIYKSGYWYYTIASGSSDRIVKRNNFSNKVKTIATNNEKWYISKGSKRFWIVGPYIAMKGNTIYYNSPTKVYSVKTNGKKKKAILSLKSSSSKKIYGLQYKSNKLAYDYATSPSSTKTERRIYK